MFMRQQQKIVRLSVVAAVGFGLAACASHPESEGLSDYGSYRCGQLEVRMTSSEGSDLVGLEYLDRRVLLKPAVAASGALYVAPGDPDTRFWSKGQRGTLTLRGQTLPECLEPGAIETSFRAMGTEPFWSVQIEQNLMTLTRPYEQQGMANIVLTETLANRHGRAYEAQYDGQSLEFRIAHQLCEDDMAGAQYPAQPNMTGDKLAAEIKKIRPDMPVILCTGFSEKLRDRHIHDLQVDGVLMKPLSRIEIAKKIRQVLDGETA
ncbi:MAG: MliC family protein [Marinobacter sp.]